MKLVWKLLRQHISIGQFAGFFVANLLGMLIVLLSVQFYQDVIPVFTAEDGFIKNTYLIVSKRISAVSTFAGETTAFTPSEQDELRQQRFCKAVGAFTASQYKVYASLGMGGANFGTDMFFESVPSSFVDTDQSQWHFDASHTEVPIILPRSYLAIYNFGFAQSQSLPKLSEGVVSMIPMDIILRGNGRQERIKGRVIGFSSRLNTILVPEDFMQWSNQQFAPEASVAPTRLIVEVTNPTDDAIATFIQDKGYELEDDQLDAGRMTYFLKVVAGVVMAVGLLISILSFYILMLSIYLLVQKNTTKLENLLLIGYSPARVSLPYQLLTTGLNVLVLVLAFVLLLWIRHYYLHMLWAMFPQMNEGTLTMALLVGIGLCIVVSLLNMIAIRRKVQSIWKRKD